MNPARSGRGILCAAVETDSTGHPDVVLTYEYDEGLNRKSVSDDLGGRIDYAHDALAPDDGFDAVGRRGAAGGRDPNNQILADDTYDNEGNRKTKTRDSDGW